MQIDIGIYNNNSGDTFIRGKSKYMCMCMYMCTWIFVKMHVSLWGSLPSLMAFSSLCMWMFVKKDKINFSFGKVVGPRGV